VFAGIDEVETFKLNEPPCDGGRFKPPLATSVTTSIWPPFTFWYCEGRHSLSPFPMDVPIAGRSLHAEHEGILDGKQGIREYATTAPAANTPAPMSTLVFVSI